MLLPCQPSPVHHRQLLQRLRTWVSARAADPGLFQLSEFGGGAEDEAARLMVKQFENAGVEVLLLIIILILLKLIFC